MNARSGSVRSPSLRLRAIRTAAGVLGLALALGAAADAKDAPTLMVAFYVKPAARAGFRSALASAQSAVLHKWRARGRLSGFELMFSRYADRGAWDAMEVLHFPDDAALAAWRRIERASPGGLDARALASAGAVETAVTDELRAGGPHTAADPAILSIPYRVAAPEDEYLRYLDGYVIPQLRGWITAGVLDSYTVAFCRYPAGRPWNAILILRYRDDSALARRTEVVQSVRARLAADPSWQAFSEAKHSTRTELQATVADRLAGEGSW